ncbi:MAG: apolipoprotein N-acyltransferase [Bacteroidetes bacterium]|nr:apolipoprotein N-acyltransferase [Bacteroidota bacterium]
MNQIKFNNFFLSVLSGLILSLSWYFKLSILAFIGFVPLLIIEHQLSLSNKKISAKLFLYSYITFLIWNLGVTWWVYNASAGGALMAFLANSLLMSFVFTIYAWIKNKVNSNYSFFLLIPIWIAWEHLHTLWDLSWTWLSLGNVFAFNHNWVQWYEYTGASGGTLWILLVNCFIFNSLKNSRLKHIKAIFVVLLLITIPIICSYLILNFKTKNTQKRESINCVVVQPNIDPYNVKFNVGFDEMFKNLLLQIKNKINSNTQFLILPETYITNNINENAIANNEALKLFSDSIEKKFPNLIIITGASSYLFYPNANDITATASKDFQSNLFYDSFNTALQLYNNKIEKYHKSKLVPGVERMPFPALLKPLEGLAIKMGGTFGSLGTQKNRSVFTNTLNKAIVAPIICYESIYGDYVSEYVRLGANCLFIITNDGWWGNTPGYIQHLNYARLRAIESRRAIARSANTGVSCFIDEYGNISDAQPWWKESVIQKNIFLNNSLTFFCRFGDVISYTSVLVTLLLVLFRAYLFASRNHKKN